MTMTPERLAELDAVMAKATAGGWQQYADDHLIIVNGEGSSLGEMSAGDPYIPESEQAANTAAIVALHNAYPDLRAHIDAQAATIARAIAIIEHCDVTAGVCCCGDDMATHAEPMSCGHSPVDHGSYTASQWLNEARAALTGAA